MDWNHDIAVTHSIDGLRGNLCDSSQCLSLSVHNHHDRIQLHFRGIIGTKMDTEMGSPDHPDAC